MAMNIRENGLMIKNKDMEFINGLMAMFLREIGREIIQKDWEYFFLITNNMMLKLEEGK